FPQLETKRLWRSVDVRACCTLFLVGFFKKAVIADNVAGVCDPIFHAPAAWDATSHWIALLLYHVQLYCDFSGYTDMALATAGLAASALGRAFAPFSMLITTFFLLLTWPVFRGEGLSGTGKIFAALAGHHAADARTASGWWLVLFAVLAIVHAANRRAVFGKLVDRLPDWAYAVAWGAAFAITLLFVAKGYRP